MRHGKTARSSEPHRPDAVVLIGFMGAGKTCVGRALGELVGWAFEDLDERIERRERRKVADIFRDSGEIEFRRVEHAALTELLADLQTGSERVVALGGGAFFPKRNAQLLKVENISTVFLDADVEVLWQRCRRQAERLGGTRPLLGKLESFRKLCQIRRPHYQKASFTQNTDGRTVKQIAEEIAQVLGLHRSGKQRGKKK